MDEISKFFKGLYYQFLLRDIAAKVIPGLFILIAIISVIGDGNVIYEAATELAGIIFLFSIGLMLGLLLRFIGNRTYVFGKRNIKLGPRTFTVRGRSFTLGPIEFSLPDINWTPIVLHAWGSEEESMKKELAFHHYANIENNNYVRTKRDRLVIFKEMAGTYAAAFSLVFVIVLV